MKHVKFTLLLTMLMSMVGYHLYAHDIEVKNADDKTIYYNFINNNTELSVTYKGTNHQSAVYSGKVVIPSTVVYNDITYKVTEIGYGAFCYCKNLESVVIPEGVTKIGGDVLHMSSVEELTLPSTIKEFTRGSFWYCDNLWNIYCHIKTPQNIDYDFLYDTDYLFNSNVCKYANLYVLKGLGDRFKRRKEWADFVYIEEYEPSYKLTYYVDETLYKDTTIKYDATINLEEEPIKEGYTFSGWSEIPETMPLYDIEVRGTFSVNSYKLTYKVDDDVYKEYTIDYGTPIIIEKAPEKKFHTFSGWSEIPETMPAHDIEVTGALEPNKFKLTYLVDGDNYKSYDVRYGSTLIPIEEPTKSGYTFSGWSEIPEIMPAYDCNIYGTFSEGGAVFPLKGDVNEDGVVTMADANMVVNIFLNSGKE